MFNAPVSLRVELEKRKYSWSLVIAWLLKILLSIVTANYTTIHEKYMDHGNPDFYYFGLVKYSIFMCPGCQTLPGYKEEWIVFFHLKYKGYLTLPYRYRGCWKE
ncbi:MAG TPA: hypothetical protein VL053_20115 [Arachidicoccus sp.]|nr:hypothetical protein [Arachidicoccus sp.]